MIQSRETLLAESENIAEKLNLNDILNFFYYIILCLSVVISVCHNLGIFPQTLLSTNKFELQNVPPFTNKLLERSVFFYINGTNYAGLPMYYMFFYSVGNSIFCLCMFTILTVSFALLINSVIYFFPLTYLVFDKIYELYTLMQLPYLLYFIIVMFKPEYMYELIVYLAFLGGIATYKRILSSYHKIVTVVKNSYFIGVSRSRLIRFELSNVLRSEMVKSVVAALSLWFAIESRLVMVNASPVSKPIDSFFILSTNYMFNQICLGGSLLYTFQLLVLYLFMIVYTTQIFEEEL